MARHRAHSPFDHEKSQTKPQRSNRGREEHLVIDQRQVEGRLAEEQLHTPDASIGLRDGLHNEAYQRKLSQFILTREEQPGGCPCLVQCSVAQPVLHIDVGSVLDQLLHGLIVGPVAHTIISIGPEASRW